MKVPSSTASEGGRRSDHQLQELKPDHFVNQGRATATDEEDEEKRKVLIHVFEFFRSVRAGCKKRAPDNCCNSFIRDTI